MTTWVYFIQVAPRGPIKIGFARDVASRLSDLQVGNPHPLRLIGAIPGDFTHEHLIHDQFKQERMRGEWFEPSLRLVRFINAAIAREAERVSRRDDEARIRPDPGRARKFDLIEDDLLNQLEARRERRHKNQANTEEFVRSLSARQRRMLRESV